MQSIPRARNLMTGFLVCLANLLSAVDHAQVMPDGEATAVLQRLNLYRSDWAAGDARIMAAVRTQEIPTHEWEWNNVVVTSGASAPLVFNASLNAIARELLEQHLVLNPRTRYDATEVLHAHGYRGDHPHLVMLGLDAPSLTVAFELALTNAIGDIPAAAGTTAPLFARVEAVKGDFREAGIAVAHTKGAVSVLMVLGAGSATRYVGGIVFLDSNRDHHYGVAEGCSGVRISCGLSSTVTGASGAWWLPLDDTLAHTITCTLGDHHRDFALPAGDSNQERCWRMPLAADGIRDQRLISDAEKALSGPSEQSRVARLRLLLATRLDMLDDSQQERLDHLTADVQEEFLAAVHAFKSTLSGEPEDILSRYRSLKKQFGSASASWVHAAKQLVETHMDLTSYLSTPADHQESMKPAILSEVTSCVAAAGDPLFMEEYLLWLEEIDRPTFDALGPLVPDAWCGAGSADGGPHPH